MTISPPLERINHAEDRFAIWDIKEGENADNLGLNGLVVSARKCAAPMAAENCTSCRK
jgi:hypothetical protein